MTDPTPEQIEEAKQRAAHMIFLYDGYGISIESGDCMHLVVLYAALEAAEKERDGLRELYTELVRKSIDAEAYAAKLEEVGDAMRNFNNGDFGKDMHDTFREWDVARREEPCVYNM